MTPLSHISTRVVWLPHTKNNWETLLLIMETSQCFKQRQLQKCTTNENAELSPVSVNTSINTSTPKAQKTLWKKGPKDCKSQRIGEFAVRLCILGLLEASPMKCHQHDCLKKSWTRTVSIDMAKQTGKASRSQPCTKNYRNYRTQATKECWEWEKWSSPGRSTPVSYPIPNCQTWKCIHK